MSRDVNVDDGKVARRLLGAVVAYLHLLDSNWETLDEEERRRGVALALEAARRGRHPRKVSD